MKTTPSIGAFCDPLLAVLGKATGFTPDQCVPSRPLVTQVYAQMGHDPENLPFPRTTNHGGDQRIRYAFAHLKAKQVPLVFTKGRGKWGLTDTGVSSAQKFLVNLIEVPEGKGNLTARWLAHRLKGAPQNKTYRKIVKRLSAKLNISATGSFIQDHVQEFFLRLIQRDGLRQRLLDGSPIYDSHLVCWAMRSAQNDIRSMGTNPVCRTLYGARTATEHRNDVRFTRDSPATFDVVEVSRYEDTGPDGIDSRFEVVSQDESPETQAIDVLWRDKVQAQMVNAIRDAKATPEGYRYVRVFDRMVEGWRIKEIAESVGMSPALSNTAIGEIRGILQTACARGRVAL